jgi:hypothetical protein
MSRPPAGARHLVARRLHNQRLAAGALRTPAEVVAWFGGVQAQEYAVAKWALAQRCAGADDGDVEDAFAAGRILRTHVMRPTWHFVAPADIRWMLTLTAPRVSAAMASYNRKLDLTPRLFARSHGIIARALEGGRFLTRAELAVRLGRRGIEASGQRLAHLVMQAELDRVICSGPRRGSQFTYALLDERAPRARELTRDASLAELARRYYSSHGPATVRDFGWWSGLTMKEARLGVELCRPALAQENIGGLTCFSAAAAATPAVPRQATYLLPIYDEYLIAYRDRGVVNGPYDPAATVAAAAGSPHHLVVGGRLAGSWGRTAGTAGVRVVVTPFRPLSAAENRQVRTAAARYGAFLGVAVETDLRAPRIGGASA